MEMLTVISEDQIEQIRRATEDILEDTGFRVANKEILERAGAAGARGRSDEAKGGW